MEISPRLTAALDYARQGIRVFPCLPGRKEPCFTDNLNRATSDPDTIKGWFTTFGDCNIAWVPGQSNRAVFDVDRKNDVDGMDAWNELRGPNPELCPTIATPTNGLHYIYRGSVKPTHNVLAEGIDTRGERSYGLLPPSVTRISAGAQADGEYSWVVPLDVPSPQIPERAAEALASRPSYTNQNKTPEGMILDRPWNIIRAENELRRLIDNGLTAGPGNRDVPCHRVACAVLDYGLSQETACELIHGIWEPACDGLTGNDPYLVEKKVASAWRGMMEKEAIGCRALPELSTLRALLPAPVVEEMDAKAAQKHRFMGYTPEEHAQLPPIEFWDDHRSKPLIPRMPGGCCMITYGPQGSHKTGVLLKELVDLALNKGARVLYVAAEGAHGIGTARLPALMRARGVPLSALTGLWITAPIQPDLLDQGDFTDLVRCYTEAGFLPDLIAFDTGTRCLGFADINATSIGTAAIKAMEAVGKPFNATVFYVTHPGKDTERGAIGSKQQENQAFGQLLVTNDGQGNITVKVEKMKDGAAHFTVPFRVNVEGIPVVTDLAPEELARRSMTTDAVHDEGRDNVWKVIYPKLERGEKITRTNRGEYGPGYVAFELGRHPYNMTGMNEDKVRYALTKLLEMQWLEVPEGAGETYVLGSEARPPGSF